MCTCIAGERALIEFWKCNAEKFPATAKAFKLAALLPTSSAAIERLFSILRDLYSDQQTRMLESHIRASTMIKYNHSTRRPKAVWVGGGSWLR
jgi:hypothetical protein